MLLNPDGFAAAAAAHLSPARGRKQGAWQALVRCVALATPNSTLMLLKPPSALPQGLPAA